MPSDVGWPQRGRSSGRGAPAARHAGDARHVAALVIDVWSQRSTTAALDGPARAGVASLGERHLRQLASEFAAHHHTERNQQALGTKLIVSMNDNAASGGRVARRQRLGGALNFYHRAA
jgi:hypothetical protein